jgi:AcrR family transcriptional regulator
VQDVADGPPGEATAHRRASDPRPARTRAAILASIERLSHLDAHQITITAITAEAGVSRSVFYKHFGSLGELLNAVLADSASSVTHLEVVAGASPRTVMTEALTQLVSHVGSRAMFYRAALGWTASVSIHDAAVAGYTLRLRILIDLVRESSPNSLVPPKDVTDFASTFLAGGLVAALTNWLLTGQATPEATLVDELLELMPAWLTTDNHAPARAEKSA